MSEKILGKWWFSSEDQKTAFAGLLDVDNRTLEIIHNEVDYDTVRELTKNKDLNSTAKDTTILGYTSHGKRITLEYLTHTSSHISFSPPHPIHAETYDLSRIVIGCHYHAPEGFKCNAFYFEGSHLYEWFNTIRPVEMMYNESNKSITYVAQQRKPAILIDTPEIQVLYRADIKKADTPKRKTIITLSPHLGLYKKDQHISYQEAVSLCQMILDFISFAVGQESKPTKITGLVLGSKNLPSTEISIALPPAPSYQEVHPVHMPIPYEIVEDDLLNLFHNWMSLHEKYIDIFNIHRITRNSSELNINNRCLNLLSSIEGFYKTKQDNNTLKFSKCLKEMTEALPKKYRPFEPSNYDTIRATRNQLAHIRDTSKKNPITSDRGLTTLYHQLMLILNYNILAELQLEDSTLERYAQMLARKIPI